MQTASYACLCFASLLVAAESVAAEPPKKELTTPLPSFAPRASAPLVVCSPLTGAWLEAKNAHTDGNASSSPEAIAGIRGEAERGDKQFLRLRFGYQALTASLGSYLNGALSWGGEFEYAVQSDAPEDFVAIKKGSGEMGMLQTLVLNRVTGTAILTLAVGSLPSHGHPYVGSTFYTCEAAER